MYDTRTIPRRFQKRFRSTIRSFDSIEQKAFEGFEQFVSLNVNAAKATFEEGTAAAQQLVSAKTHKNSSI